MTVDLSVSLGSQDGCGSIPKEAPLLASCPVPGQDGTLLRRAMASLAPPSPSVKKSESIAPHFLRRGPPSSDGRIWPAGASGAGRRLQIGCARLLLQWTKTTRAWLGAANPLVHRRFIRSACSALSGSPGARGCAPICRPRHVNRVTRGSAFAVGEFPQKLGALDAQVSKSKVSPSGPHGRLAAFCGLPARP